MTDPTAPSPAPSEEPAPPITIAEVLAELRLLENQLYSDEVEEQVRALPDPADKQAFGAARAHLTQVISKLSTEELRDIRQQLEQHGPALQEGIAALNRSVARLDAVTAWAGAINGVIGVLGQIVSLI